MSFAFDLDLAFWKHTEWGQFFLCTTTFHTSVLALPRLLASPLPTQLLSCAQLIQTGTQSGEGKSVCPAVEEYSGITLSPVQLSCYQHSLTWNVLHSSLLSTTLQGLPFYPKRTP